MEVKALGMVKNVFVFVIIFTFKNLTISEYGFGKQDTEISQKVSPEYTQSQTSSSTQTMTKLKASSVWHPSSSSSLDTHLVYQRLGSLFVLFVRGRTTMTKRANNLLHQHAIMYNTNMCYPWHIPFYSSPPSTLTPSTTPATSSSST